MLSFFSLGRFLDWFTLKEFTVVFNKIKKDLIKNYLEGGSPPSHAQIQVELDTLIGQQKTIKMALRASPP